MLVNRILLSVGLPDTIVLVKLKSTGWLIVYTPSCPVVPLTWATKNTFDGISALLPNNKSPTEIVPVDISVTVRAVPEHDAVNIALWLSARLNSKSAAKVPADPPEPMRT